MRIIRLLALGTLAYLLKQGVPFRSADKAPQQRRRQRPHITTCDAYDALRLVVR